MQLTFNTEHVADYKSASQRARILTERWVDDHIFCPNCGHDDIVKYPDNQPVADFYCSNCHEDYELKSKENTLGTKIVDGAYRTMIERLNSFNNPNFFLLNYDLTDLSVISFAVIPKHFFIPDIIEKRKPLSETARRAGWIGCNILLNHIPNTGKIFFVHNREVKQREKVLAEWQKTLFLRDEKEPVAKGWLLDTMKIVEKIGKSEFSLEDVYKYEAELSKLHPENNHIKDKLRQQLQLLRDRNYLEFTSRANYRLTHF